MKIRCIIIIMIIISESECKDASFKLNNKQKKMIKKIVTNFYTYIYIFIKIYKCVYGRKKYSTPKTTKTETRTEICWRETSHKQQQQQEKRDICEKNSIYHTKKTR